MHLHEKFYGSDEQFAKKYAAFKDNVEKARLLNKQSNSNSFGITKFMDMTEEDFAATYLSKKMMSRENAPSFIQKVEDYPVRDLPTSWDWRTKGAVTPVKNQGACGSCWAFSTTGNVEGAWFLKTGKLSSLSEQNLVDCDKECDSQGDCDAGCNGGLMWNAFEYIIKNKGIDTESSYPYEGIDDTCRFNKANVGANITSWKMAPTDENQLAQWLIDNGPVSIAINAGPMQYYVGGIADPLLCNPKHLDHGVLLVGFGVGKNWLGKEEPYWIIKNSWGTGWGEQGYYRIIRGKGKCGLNSVPCSSFV